MYGYFFDKIFFFGTIKIYNISYTGVTKNQLKMKLLKIKTIILSTFLGLAVVSCSKNDDNVPAPELTVNDVRDIVKTNQVIDDVLGLAKNDSFFSKTAGKSKGSTETVSCFFKNFVDVELGKKVKLDFGNGCTFFGKKYEGKLEIVYQKIDNGYKRMLTFDGFSINGTKVAGNSNFEMTFKNKAGNFAVATDANLVIEFATGKKITRKGNWNVETSKDLSTSMSGNWESLSLDGFTRSISISKPLKTKLGCIFATEGVMKINYGNRSYALDFGKGECDDKVSFTNADGKVTEFSLTEKK